MPERAASSGGRRRPASVTGSDPLCPICLEGRRHAVETSCGHLFCAKCLLVHREQSEPLRPMLCPLCRQQVTLLFLCYTGTELACAEPEAVSVRSATRRTVTEYNRRFSGLPRPETTRREIPRLRLEAMHLRQGLVFDFVAADIQNPQPEDKPLMRWAVLDGWLEHIRDVPCLLRHLWREAVSPGGVLLLLRVRVVMCFLMALVYLVLPFDLLPEAVYGAIGLLDDLFIVVAMLMYVAVLYRWYLAAPD
ncbi:E3 ubiquitin-protein ligase RNF170 [Amphibalanus amphitrite]|uniref:E3 ubiquitin-protein ligase RNF170 n=1 Tax=Amphibalanus amphitrite TaxID=1232801 RepID=A0A6A4WT68_AMPAM|nr:E3 ubiquitin-protein ligase RNF170 [Amphibalanus amphitrite]